MLTLEDKMIIAKMFRVIFKIICLSNIHTAKEKYEKFTKDFDKDVTDLNNDLEKWINKLDPGERRA